MSYESGSESSLPMSLSPMETNTAHSVAMAAAAAAAEIDADDAAAAAAATAAALHALDDEEDPPMPTASSNRLMAQQQQQQQQQSDEQLLELTDPNELLEEQEDIADQKETAANEESTKQKPSQPSNVPSLMDLIVTPSGARKRVVGGVRPLLPEQFDPASAYRPVAKRQRGGFIGVAGLIKDRSLSDNNPSNGQTGGEIPSLLELDCSGGVGGGGGGGPGGIPSLLDCWTDGQDVDSYYHHAPGWLSDDQTGYDYSGGGSYYPEADYYSGYANHYQLYGRQGYDYRQQQQRQPQPLLNWGVGNRIVGLLDYDMSSAGGGGGSGGLLGMPSGNQRHYQRRSQRNVAGGASKVPSLMPSGPPSLLDFM